jgi:cell division protein FtsI (penicillin-binding protein 3)
MGDKQQTATYSLVRHYFVLSGVVLLFVGLIGRAIYLQVIEQDFLLRQGSDRQLRVIATPAYRGAILDRNGSPLAVSTPVDVVGGKPVTLLKNMDGLKKVAELIELDFPNLVENLKQRADREFVYLKRGVQPDLAQRALGLIDGLSLEREYNRFYPSGEVAAHILGFTDIDDIGRGGLEGAYQDWLKATAGKRKILRDLNGRVIEDIAQVAAAKPGRDIHLSLDMRLQYITYRSLARAIKHHNADAGSAVVLDAHNGEILALANFPSYNPNNITGKDRGSMRNRAVTDVFEPGSTIKPFTIAAALDRNLYNERSRIDTSPGYMRVTGFPVKDLSNNGELDLAGILRKSSNVGASKVALSMRAEDLWQSFNDYGFGQPSGVDFPAATAGYLSWHGDWQPLDHATMAFGYGLSVSALQLARAYSLFANDGRLVPVSLLRVDEAPEGVQVMKKASARRILRWLEEVVGPGGTARSASITGYRVAGKTGTVKKSAAGGYLQDSYQAVFAGIAPVSQPRLVMVAMIDNPRENGYYGGQVAAPVFQEVMSQSLRLLNVSPDDLPALRQMAGNAGKGA